MNGKQAKRCRAVVHAEAVKQGLWKQGEAFVYSKWWRKLAARIFPRLRKRYADAVGRWYKHTTKGWTRRVAAYIHDREAQARTRKDNRAFRVARAQINRKYAQERAAKRLSPERG